MTHIRFVLTLPPKKPELSVYPLEDLKNWGPSCSVEKARECLMVYKKEKQSCQYHLGNQGQLKNQKYLYCHVIL